MWNSNELTTDEAICSWGDDGIQQFDYNSYDASHPMMNGYFNRLTTGISYCNQYLQVAADQDAQKIAEIRFIRALHYYLLMDAFGNVPQFQDKGIRKRAIVAIGQQDVALTGIFPADPGIQLLGASSDHMLIDVTDSQQQLKVGDTISFKLNYQGLLHLSNTRYVAKNYIDK